MDKIKSKEFLKKQYDGSSILQTRINFHTKYSTNEQSLGEWLLSNYEIKERYKVLELGSGGGGMWQGTIDSLPKDIEITLSDLSDGTVKEMAEKFDHPNVNLRQIDIQNIPYDDEKFDIVIANFMLQHVPDIDKAISEVARVLKNGGVFYAATATSYNMVTFFDKTLHDFDKDIERINPLSFQIENGKEYLSKHFSDITIKEYRNDSYVSDTNDILDYLYSSSFAGDVKKYSRQELFDYYESIKDSNGEIYIKKVSGTFVAKK